MAIDPLCKKKVSDQGAIKTLLHDHMYYFCSEYCRDRFLKLDVKGEILPPESNFSPSSIYTCPMHSEVFQDHTGDCPKCGMRLEDKEDEEDKLIRSLSRKFRTGLILAIPVVFLSFVEMILPSKSELFISYVISCWSQLFLSTGVVFWAGGFFFIKAGQSIVNKSLNRFTLIALSVGTAYSYSAVAVLLPQIFPESLKKMGKIDLYFEVSVSITLLVILGQILEAKARSRTGHEIKGLLSLAAKNAHRIRDGKEEDVPIDSIQKGDLLRVCPGEKVPLDGIIIKGTSTIDESMISGESPPIEKNEGDQVIGATFNQTGTFLMHTDKIGSETLLSQIVLMVAKAQRSRAPIQGLTDKVSKYFVPIVMVISVLTFILWVHWGPQPQFAFALVNSIAVLIIACPCALGLAIPMSIMVGTGRGAQSGILVKNAEALERSARITHVLMDKTGTLTEGKPRVSAVYGASGIEDRFVIEISGSLEKNSDHPLACSIVDYAKEKEIVLKTVQDFESIAGGGVKGNLMGQVVVLGKSKFIERMTVTLPDDLMRQALDIEEKAQTVVWVGMNKKVIGIIGISDPIKKTSPEAIKEFHRLGLKVIMLTGDNQKTARAIAKELYIDDVRAELEPQDKQRIVKEFKEQGALVLMAGDGIQDAPALAEAEVGVAMSIGTHIAIESAGIILVKGDLHGIVKALRLSRSVMHNIRQNLFFAFIYNAVGVSVAAGILYPSFGILLSPLVAAFAMSFSSVSVIGNALRLRKY